MPFSDASVPFAAAALTNNNLIFTQRKTSWKKEKEKKTQRTWFVEISPAQSETRLDYDRYDWTTDISLVLVLIYVFGITGDWQFL